MLVLGATSASGADEAGDNAAAAPAKPAVVESEWRRPWYSDHAVRLEADDRLPLTAYIFDDGGKLVPAARRPVTIMRDGKPYVAADDPTVATNELGQAQLHLTPGIYSIAVGKFGEEDGFAFTTIRVLPAIIIPPRAYLKGVALPQIPRSPKGIEVALIRPQEVTVLEKLLARRFGKKPTGNSTEPKDPEVKVTDWYRPPTRPLVRLVSAVDGGFDRSTITLRTTMDSLADRWDAIPYDGPWHFHHEILLEPNRSLVGNMRTFNEQGDRSPIVDAEVIFLRDGSPWKELRTDTNGDFTAEAVEPGIYSVISANDVTFGCYSVRIIADETVQPAQPAAPNVRTVALHRSSTASRLQVTGLNTTVGTEANSAGYMSNFGPGAAGAGGLGAGTAAATTTSASGAAGASSGAVLSAGLVGAAALTATQDASQQ